MRKVVITGGTSFLGRYVIQNLLENNYEVHALVRESSANLSKIEPHRNLHFIYGSLDEIETLELVGKADFFIHFAWDGSGKIGRADETVQNKNVDYAMRALMVSEKLQCHKFVFPGSQAEYGILHTEITEDSPCNPVSPYGKAKYNFGVKAEQYCMDKQLKFIHLRIFSVYGPGDREGTLVDACIRKFNSGEEQVLGPCQQYWNFLYISDFAEAIKALLEHECDTGIYNIAGEHTAILRQYVEQIYELSNQSGAYKFGEQINNPEGVPDLNPCIAKIIDSIGWKPQVSFSDGIELMMKELFGGK